MVYESAADAKFSVRYRRDADRFSVEPIGGEPFSSVARLELGNEKDFILFNNDQPGKIESASHSGLNHLAITTLSRIVFDQEYRLFCESIREGAAIYDTPERTATVIVEYSNGRRLGRIALHALAEGASPEVIALQQRIIDSLAPN